jgi:hypothetical protein
LLPQTTISVGLEPGQAGGFRIDQLWGGGATIGVVGAVACSRIYRRITAPPKP